MRLLTPLAALACAAPALAQIPPMTATPDEIVVDVVSGHGPAGGASTEITVLEGPNSTGFSGNLQMRHFRAAQNGPAAYVMAAPPWPIQSLSTHPDARWIAPNTASESGASTAAGLFAIEFDVPEVPLLQAKLDLTFSSDDFLGWGANNGVWLNELEVPGTGQSFWHNDQFAHMDLDVSGLLRQGTNRLYLYLVNTGGPGGLMFHARFRINTIAPDDCADAFPATLDDNAGSTDGFTTSPEAAACGFSGDRWYWLVPPSSGSLTATLTGSGPGFAPGLGVFTGSCGALTQVACATGPATWTGNVTAGVPLLLSVGSAGAGTGTYNLRLELDQPSGGLVNPANGHLYTITPGLVDIATARAQAAAQGGYLAAINDPAENAWVQSQMAAGAAVWLGLSDEVTEGTFLWDSGEPFTFNSWNAGEPNDSQVCNGEDYVEMLGGGLWNDLNTGLNPCGNHIRRGLIEIPSSGLANVADLGGGCGEGSIAPQLWSAPHKLGTVVDMAVLYAGPGDTIFLNQSSSGGVPTIVGDCTVHLDGGSTSLIAVAIANEYGSATFPIAVPSSPALIGTVEVWQAQVIPPSAAVSYTNGIASTLGS